jgi:hypothetical protein
MAKVRVTVRVRIVTFAMVARRKSGSGWLLVALMVCMNTAVPGDGV